jgi:pimeloyl-ACP methyl ester carboxylesterase
MVHLLQWSLLAAALAYAALIALSYMAPRRMMARGRTLGAALSGFSRNRIHIAGHDIAYCEAGRGETVLLLHGFGASKETWLAYARRLTRRYRVVIPDLPGFGESSFDHAQAYGFAEQVPRLHAFVHALDLGRLHLAGNSMGGGIAGIYAATYPDDVNTLLLMDTSGVNMPQASEFVTEVAAGRNPLIARSLSDIETLFDFTFHRKPPLPAFAKRIYAADCQARQAANDHIFQDAHRDLTALERELPSISASTLIMWGAHDRIVDRSVVDVLEHSLRNHSTVVYKECGHLPYIEQPIMSARDHLRFLENVAREQH